MRHYSALIVGQRTYKIMFSTRPPAVIAKWLLKPTNKLLNIGINPPVYTEAIKKTIDNVMYDITTKSNLFLLSLLGAPAFFDGNRVQNIINQ